MVNLVSRNDLKIKTTPAQSIEVGAVFRYTGPYKRLRDFVLVHKLDPELKALPNQTGETVRLSDHVAAEVLCPDLGYTDYCLFWIEKKYLRSPTEPELSKVLEAIAAQQK
jgi:hypothetical protein